MQPPQSPRAPNSGQPSDAPGPVPSDSEPAPMRPKVLLLRPRAVETAGGERTSTRALTLDLQTQIDGLRSIKSDLEAYYWDHPGDDEPARAERFQIGYWIRQVADRTSALETILLHHGTHRVIVSGVTSGERAALRTAGMILDQWLHEETPFASVLRTVAAVLGAADRIALRAAGGTALHGDRERGRP